MNFKLTAIVCLLGSVTACQAPQMTIAEQHQKAVTQWYSLAQFSGNSLSQFGLTIVGSLVIDNDNKFRVINVRLAKEVNSTEIDLLNLNFANKFVCSDKCYQVTKVDNRISSKTSLLTQMFTSNESELFEFYGLLFQINRIINEYQTHVPNEFTQYISFLSKENIKHDSVGSFAAYLDEAFSKKSVVNFVSFGNSDKSFELIMEMEDLPNTPSEYGPSKQWHKSNQASESNDLAYMPKESEQWINEESGKVTGDHKIVLDIVKENEKNLKFNIQKIQNFNVLKTAVIRIGDLVCSFSDNIIGIVKENDMDNNILLSKVGQGVEMIDGIKVNAAPGYFYREQVAAYIFSNKGESLYSRNDLTRCDFDGLDELIKLVQKNTD